MGLMKFAAALGAALVVGAPAHAAVTAIGMPDAGYVGGTTLLQINTDDFETLSSLGDAAVNVNFDTVEARTASFSFGPWGVAPDTEGDTPRILYAAGVDSMTFNFDQDLSIFGFEGQPDALGVVAMSVDYYLDGVKVGSIGRSIDGVVELDSNGNVIGGGARLLAGEGRFDKVVVNGAGGFALGQLRYALAGPVSAVPEPGAWALMIVGFGAAGTMIRRSRRNLAIA